MRRSWGSAAAITALCGAVLAGCGGEAAEESAPPSPQQAVQEGIEALVEAGSADFTSHVELGDLQLDQTGTFTVQPQAQRTTDTVVSQGETRMVEILGVGGEVYVSLPDDDRTPTACYLTGDTATMAALSGVDVADDDARLPRAAVVAASAQGSSTGEGGALVGTVDLASVLSLVGTSLVDRLGIAPGDTRVGATLDLEGGALTGFEVDGGALNRAAAEADLSGGDQAFPADTVIAATFDDVGGDVAIEPPAEGDVVSVDQDDSGFDAEADACRAG